MIRHPIRARRLLAPAGASLLRLGGIALAFAAPAMARAADAPPAVSLRNPAKPWIGFLIIFVLVAAVLAVSLYPSKRGHQD